MRWRRKRPRYDVRKIWAEPTDNGWWVIQGSALLGMLYEAANGADPGIVFAEHYANCDHEYPVE